MTGYGLFNLMRVFFWALLGFLIGMSLIIRYTTGLIIKEVEYHKKFGKEWVQEFEKYNGPLSQTNTRIAVGILSLIAICLVAWWGYRNMNPYKSSHRKQVRRKQS
jgi:hypothetical protein